MGCAQEFGGRHCGEVEDIQRGKLQVVANGHGTHPEGAIGVALLEEAART